MSNKNFSYIFIPDILGVPASQKLVYVTYSGMNIPVVELSILYVKIQHKGLRITSEISPGPPPFVGIFKGRFENGGLMVG